MGGYGGGGYGGGYAALETVVVTAQKQPADTSGDLAMIEAGIGLIVVGGAVIALAPEVGAAGLTLAALNLLGGTDIALGGLLAGTGAGALVAKL